MPLVERRVALEARNALLDYKRTSACRCFPWPEMRPGDGVSDAGSESGPRSRSKRRVPQAWPAGLLPSSTFRPNDWARVTHLCRRVCLEQAGQGCTTCAEANLTIDSLRGYEVVLLTPGFATGKPATLLVERLLRGSPRTANGNDRFVTPRSARCRAQQHLWCRWRRSGVRGRRRGVLIVYAPCAEPGGGIRGACQAAPRERIRLQLRISAAARALADRRLRKRAGQCGLCGRDRATGKVHVVKAPTSRCRAWIPACSSSRSYWSSLRCSSAAYSCRSRRRSRTGKSTRHDARSNSLYDLLLGFAAANGYFPCPADASSNGQEQLGTNHASGSLSFMARLSAGRAARVQAGGRGGLRARRLGRLASNRIRYAISEHHRWPAYHSPSPALNGLAKSCRSAAWVTPRCSTSVRAATASP